MKPSKAVELDEAKEFLDEWCSVSKYQCNDCGSFDVFYDEHEEMDNPTLEAVCNKCESRSIADYQGLVAFELQELLDSKIQTAVQAERERCYKAIDDVYDYGISRDNLLDAIGENNN